MNNPMQKSRLGRGLASLIGEPVSVTQTRGPVDGEQRLLPLDQIRPGRFNPRKDFNEDDLAELADSIRQRGLVQPIVVRPDPAGFGFEIVAGERRWRACQRAGLHNVPAIVRELGDQEVLEIAIIENVQRTDLNAIEEAGGYRELIERFNYTQDKLAEVIGKSRSHLANTLRLLKLPDSVQAMVQQGKLTAGHARALIGRDDAETLAQRIIHQALNVREAEALAQGGDATVVGPGGVRRPREKDADTKHFEKELTDVLGLKVEIKRGSGESGTISIRYGNYDQLEYIRMRLAGSSGE